MNFTSRLLPHPRKWLRSSKIGLLVGLALGAGGHARAQATVAQS